MPRLKYLDSAKADLVQISNYIAKRSQNARIGRDYAAVLRKRCKDLASHDFTLGTPRPEIRKDLRSIVEGNYVILFRYADNCLEVVNIVEGHQDIEGMFEEK